ncbi:CCDC112 [Symbiodinium necroappetens]|uniref:CCDC112 protein n=1 Tax=Symbiodinium necroappetens TaxID=1628268 RepID=A0A812RH00_9DINO|nr:CCDC112 [Symbiodinium necroappetens]
MKFCVRSFEFIFVKTRTRSARHTFAGLCSLLRRRPCPTSQQEMKEPEAELPSPREAPSEAEAEVTAWRVQWASLKEEAGEYEEGCCDERFVCHDSEQALENWANSLWAGLADLRASVKRLQTPESSGPSQGQTAQDVQRSFQSFKAEQSQAFERLLGEQQLLEDALASLEKRFDSWVGVLLSLLRWPLFLSSGNAFLEDPELLQLKTELQELEAVEVQEPSYGGWAETDHQVFVRILRVFRMQATSQCYARLAFQFPDLSEAALADHVKWYSEHQARQARRRLLLARWRERRSFLSSQSQANEKRNQAPVREMRERSRDEQRRRVRAWREAREEEESRLAAMQRQVELEQAREARRREKRHQKKLKEFAEAYRKQRDEEKRQAAQSLSSQASQRALSEEDRQRIVQRNLAMLTKKMQAMPRGDPPQSVQRNPAYDHVKSRLHDQTRSFAQKIAQKEDEEEEAQQ